MSDSELLAIILRSGGTTAGVIELSTKLLKEFGSLRKLLFADLNYLISIRYLGVAKAASICAVGELAARCFAPEELDRPEIDTPLTVYDLIRPRILGKEKECLYLLSLDLRNKLIKINLISVGTLSQALSDSREVLRTALLNNASSIIIAHNHPSGGLEPSNEDRLFTERLALTAVQIGINFLDHVIVTSDGHYSFKKGGLLSFNNERR